MDVANGYSQYFVEKVEYIRHLFPQSIIMAGNVVTPEMVLKLIHAGADIVKIGIGSGSVCTTRLKTGIGYPQLSAIIECADAAHSVGGHICSDGGCTVPADVCKAFCANADFVMLGGMLAGTDGCDGNWKYNMHREKESLQFYGMSSKAANDKHFGGLKEYRASEGRDVLVPYRGSVMHSIQEILGGIRSTCTYAGAKRLKHLMRCTTFVRCTKQFNDVYA